MNLEGRLALYDAAGPFGNPTSDSLRTCVTARTQALLMVIFAPAGYPTPRMEAHVQAATSLMGQYLARPNGAVSTSTRVLP